MATITREPLNKTENEKLLKFIGKCVIDNVVFPPMQIGGASVTIQELLHNRSIESLGKYADFLETQGGKISRTDRINGVKEKKISQNGPTYTEVIEIIDLIIKASLYKQGEALREKRIIEIKKELEQMETPKERKAKLQSELDSLG